MEEHSCPRCGSAASRKNGSTNGKPKRKCKTCGYQYSSGGLKGFSPALQHLAVVLYLHGLSLRTVAKLLRTTATSVQRWVKLLAEKHGQRPEAEPGGAVIMELDEPERSGDGRRQLWHFLKKNPASYGFGRLSAGRAAVFLIGNAAVVTKPR